MDILTRNEKDMIAHFWKHTQCLENWVEWDEARLKIKSEMPKLLRAYNDYKYATERMNTIVNYITKGA